MTFYQVKSTVKEIPIDKSKFYLISNSIAIKQKLEN